MKVTMIPIVFSALGTVLKDLKNKRREELEIRRRIETNQTTALLGSAKILRRILEIWREFFSLRIQWKKPTI